MLAAEFVPKRKSKNVSTKTAAALTVAAHNRRTVDLLDTRGVPCRQTLRKTAVGFRQVAETDHDRGDVDDLTGARTSFDRELFVEINLFVGETAMKHFRACDCQRRTQKSRTNSQFTPPDDDATLLDRL